MAQEGSDELTGVHKTYEKYQEKIDKYKKRYKMLSDFIHMEHLDAGEYQSVRYQLSFLEEGLRYLTNANMENQKATYEATHSTDYSRTIVRIPLDKKINSFYDDLTLEVVFYDDVCTPKGKFKEYSKLTNTADRMTFIKNNTEITHMGLAYIRNDVLQCVIALQGKLNHKDPRVESGNVTLLDSKFADFENLTLEDTLNSEIASNDLKQWLQTKIDLDKEGMIQLASTNIRGDIYQIYRSPFNDDLYIRYVCRSTGRIYYNRLNLINLKISDYFKEDDYESYSKAWWHLNTLGSNPEGEPVIRC